MTLIDEFTRECLAIRVARRINSLGVIETMADVDARARRPGTHPLRQRSGDDGQDRAQLAGEASVPRRSTSNPEVPGRTATAKCFNGKLRDELLNGEIFYSLKEAKVVIEQWRKHYNTVRPHSSLGYRPPAPQTSNPFPPLWIGRTDAVVSLSRWYKISVRPLVVDVDGTLIKSDLLIESFLMLLSTKPLHALAALGSLLQGRAAFKARVASETRLDTSRLPFNPGIWALLKAEKRKGRKLYLASASDNKLVEALARRLGIFSGVFASNGKTNLKGTNKAAALCAAFGKGGFDYAGDSQNDVAVWLKSKGVLVVGTTRFFLERIRSRFPHARGIDERHLSLKDYVRAMRVHQWLKNLLIFVPCLLAHRYRAHDLFFLGLAFLSFSLCASSGYIANDLLDLRNDR